MNLEFKEQSGVDIQGGPSLPAMILRKIFCRIGTNFCQTLLDEFCSTRGDQSSSASICWLSL